MSSPPVFAPCVGKEAPITLVVTVRRSPKLCSGGARSCGALLALACASGGERRRTPTRRFLLPERTRSQTRAAWDQKHFGAAELSYKSALDHGGLAPPDTLDAYVHLGAARARLGKKELARAAFRQAALIDRHFKTPPEAGKRATAIAALARRDEAKLGSIVLNATIPQSVPAGESFSIDATLDPKHAAVTAKVGASARDPLSGKHWETTDVSAPSVHFEIPASVTLPGATLIVRIDALDPHDNRLASREQRVQVEALEPRRRRGAPAEPAPPQRARRLRRSPSPPTSAPPPSNKDKSRSTAATGRPPGLTS